MSHVNEMKDFLKGERGDNEDQTTYRKRQMMAKYALKRYLKGRLVWDSANGTAKRTENGYERFIPKQFR